MFEQQLTRRVLKKPNQKTTGGLFLSLKAQAVELLQQLDLYRQNNIANYYLHVADLSTRMQNCSRYEKGELCLLLCQTAVAIDLPINSLPLPSDFRLSVSDYVNHLMEEGDAVRLKQQTTRQVYQGRFKNTTERRVAVDSKSKFRDLLLIDRIDVVLVRMMEESAPDLGLSKVVQQFMVDALVLAFKYLGDQFQGFKANVQTIVHSAPTSKTFKRNSSLQHNYAMLGQITDTIIDSQVTVSRKDQLKPRSIHRSSSRVLIKTNSIHDSIISSHELQQQKLPQYTSLRIKGSINKRGSGSKSVAKRGSIQEKKSGEFVVRKSTHFSNKCNEGSSKDGAATTEKRNRSRFGTLTKNEINALREVIPSHKSQFSVNEEESIVVRKRQTSHFSNIANENDEEEQLQSFYIFLQEGHRVTLLTLQQIYKKEAGSEDQSIELSLISDSYAVVSSQMLTKQLGLEIQQVFYEQYEQEITMKQLMAFLQVYRNKRNQLTLSIANTYNKAKSCNIVQVAEPQCGLLMGFVRKVSTHFIVQCIFDKRQLQNSYQRGIKRRLLTIGETISFKVAFNYKLMNQDLYMTYEQDRNYVKNRGCVIISGQRPQSCQLGIFTSERNYKTSLSTFTVKEVSQVRFYNVWWNSRFNGMWQPPKNKRKDKRSGTEIMKKKLGTSFDRRFNKERLAKNKSSIIVPDNNGHELERIAEHVEFTNIQSTLKTASRREVPTSEQLSSRGRIAKAERAKKKQMDRGRQLIQSMRTEKGYKLVRKWVLQQPETLKYNEYYGYLERRVSLIEYHKEQTSFSGQNQHNYLKSRLTIHGMRKKGEPRSTKLLTFLKRLKSESTLLGYLVGSIKLLIRDKNRYVFLQVYWQSMQKYFIFVLTQDLFQKITQIELDHFDKHSFAAPADKQQPKRRQKRTSVVSSLMRSRDKDYVGMKKSNETPTLTLKVPKMLSLERDAEPKSQNSHKFKQRINTIFKIDKSSDSFSFSTFGNMKQSERLHFKREVATYIKTKFIKNVQFVWRQHTLVLQIYNLGRSGQKVLQIEGKELAVKNIHLSKTTLSQSHQPTHAKAKEWQRGVSATQLLVVRYKESNLANLKFYTAQGLSKIYLQHLFIKNNDELFGCYKSKLSLRDINDNNSRVAEFYTKENGFFERTNKDNDNAVPISQPQLKHFFSKHSNKEEQKRYKYAEIINFAKKCTLSFDFIENKRKRLIKDVFVIPNRYPHLQLQQFMLSVEITFDDVFIRDLNGDPLLTFSKHKLQNYFPYIFRINKAQLKTLLVQRLLRDEDLIRLCQLNPTDSNSF